MISERLAAIQAELKAPKGQYNSFGKYRYRSCEDILEAVKPLLSENGCTLVLDDEVREVGGRVYVVATARIFEASEPMSSIEANGWAREPEEKKGMDAAQVTGTASSYARKYALNALLLIDDSKDADTDEHRREKAAVEAAMDDGPDLSMFEAMVADAAAHGIDKRAIWSWMRETFGKSFDDMTDGELAQTVEHFRGLMYG